MTKYRPVMEEFKSMKWISCYHQYVSYFIAKMLCSSEKYWGTRLSMPDFNFGFHVSLVPGYLSGSGLCSRVRFSLCICVCVCVCVCVLVTQLCLTLCNTMDCSPPGSSVHGFLQARILDWVSNSFSRRIFLTQGFNPGLPQFAGKFFTVWATREELK